MIGNDIIDLETAKIESNWQKRGFLEKLFSKEEQSCILKAENPELCVWLFWSIKEAGYKATQRKFNLKPAYNPMDFKIEIKKFKENWASGEVRFKNETYPFNSEICKEFIHSIVGTSTSSEILISPDAKIELIHKISAVTRIPFEEISVIKGINRIPHLYHGEQNLEIPFSLSHHGKYSSFAFSLNIS